MGLWGLSELPIGFVLHLTAQMLLLALYSDGRYTLQMGALTRASRDVIAMKDENPEWYAGIVERVAGGVGCWQIAAEEGVLYGALMKWVRADEERNRLMLDAQTFAAQKMVDESLEIADTLGDEGNTDDAFKAKLKIDTRMKIAGKLDPRFGNGPQLNVSGTNVQVVMTDFRNFAPDSDVLESE